jgi:hypothetical protein
VSNPTFILHAWRVLRIFDSDGLSGAVGWKSRIKTIEAVSCAATASPLLFDFLQPSGMGSSGIELVGYGFRLSYARCRDRCSDSDSNCIMTNPCSFRKLFA